MCVERATEQELVDLCADIAHSQMMEADEMRGFLKSWYGQDKEPMISPMMQRDLDRLAALEGKAFDRALAKTFIATTGSRSTTRSGASSARTTTSSRCCASSRSRRSGVNPRLHPHPVRRRDHPRTPTAR